MQTALITGANRGFGYEFAKQYAELGWHVLTGCRQPEAAVSLHLLAEQHPGRLHVITLEMGSEASILSASSAIRESTTQIDVLINNAGMGYGAPDLRHLDSLGTMTMETQLDVFRLNAVGPLIFTQSLLDLLRRSRSPKVVNISSWLGSIGERNATYAGSFGYSASKAALNMYSRILSFALVPEGIAVVAIDPGYARTEMGGPNAEQDVAETVRAMIGRIEALTMTESGRFLLWRGGETEW